MTEPPRDTLNIYGRSDYAVTSNEGDYTVHVVVGVDPENRMYLLDLWRGHARKKFTSFASSGRTTSQVS